MSLSSVPPSAFACTSDLDNTFGVGGIGISTPIFDPGDWNSVAVQPSGKIVLAGRSGHFVAVVRLNSTGSLDTEFNGDGKHAFRYATGDEQVCSEGRSAKL